VNATRPTANTAHAHSQAPRLAIAAISPSSSITTSIAPDAVLVHDELLLTASGRSTSDDSRHRRTSETNNRILEV
jgi:hypothetical protein